MTIKETFNALYEKCSACLKKALIAVQSRAQVQSANVIRPKTSEENCKNIAIRLGIPTLTSLSDIDVDKSLIKRISYSFVKRTLVLPVLQDDTTLTVATFDPLATEAFDELRFHFKKDIKLVWVPKESILTAASEYYQQDENAANILLEEVGGRSSFDHDEDIYDILEDDSQQPPAVRLLNLIIGEAIKREASDIHFDPDERGLVVRLRIDGVLHQHLSPPQDLMSPLITRIKVMAKMDIAERRLPQDGRLKIRMGSKFMDFRMSTLPVAYGERVVLRLLDKGSIVLGLDHLGMPKDALQKFRQLIAYSEGMLLVTGPTGSGKTTTLYSALTELKSSEVNIMTIEDPVEYRLQGIAQMGVHPKIGLTFSTGLRHILRQDPDIIMIGEIRDKETAEIAIQSALTGHLVLSTLHTNDACSAITRLVDMGIEPYLISSCCLGALAQRLVRKLCVQCRNQPQSTPCPVCHGSGFSGRHGMYELMTLTPTIRQQIAKSPEASLLLDIAKKEGLQLLREHGKDLIARGITTEEEVWRVTRAEE